MAIKQWEENARTYYQIDVCVYGANVSTIRRQKRESGSIDETEVEVVARKLRKIEDRLKEEALREVIELEGQGISWGDLVTRWKRSLYGEMLENRNDTQALSVKKNRKERTLNDYIQAVVDFTTDLNETSDPLVVWTKIPATQITPADVEDLFRKMARLGYSNCRQYNVKVAISQCFRFGIMKRLLKGVTVSPTFGFGISRKESKRPEILNGPQIEKLLSEARRLNHPWRAIWEGCYHMGFRSGEGQELRAKDVDFPEKMVCLERQYDPVERKPVDLKDGEWRQVPINDDLYELFTELGVQDMNPEDLVFPQLTSWRHGEQARHLRAFCEQIEIPSICFHTLRACWATHLLRNGVDRVTVMKLGGWSDLETMERYIRLAGIDVKGSTNSLSIRKKERPARVLRLLDRGI